MEALKKKIIWESDAKRGQRGGPPSGEKKKKEKRKGKIPCSKRPVIVRFSENKKEHETKRPNLH